MANLQYWNFLAECGLLASLLYFGYRFLRAPSTINANIAQLQELQAGLRQAIREADEAGRTLGEQFGQRKSALEKLLFDLETVEARVGRAITAAEERKGSLELEIKRAARTQEDIIAVQPPAKEPSIAKIVRRAEASEPIAEAVIEVPEAPSFESAAAPLATAKSVANRTNIYGEAIGEITVPPVQPEKKSYSPLASSIEREVATASSEKANSRQALEDLYASAEKLLRAGQAVDQVTAATRLSADEVRMLAHIIDEERKDISEKLEQQTVKPNEIPVDQRLGVLGGIKRQVQVL